MLRSFTESLGAYLISRLASLPEKPVASFALPGAVAGQNAVNIFLSALAENVDLRSNEQQLKRDDLMWVAKKPPLRLKCTYIVSVWPAIEDREEAALIQQELLCAAYAAIVATRKLPDAFVPAPMKAPGLPAPIIERSGDELPHDPEFWTAAGCMFHPAFSFSATISLPLAEEQYDNAVEGVKIGYQVNP